MEFKRCYGCMAELEAEGAVCPHCGYDNTNGPASQPSHVLPCGTVLNGQYVVGRSLGQGGFGITYIGYDLNLEIPVCIKEYYPEGAAMRSANQSRMVYWGTSENAEHLKQSRKSFVKEAQKAVKLRDLNHVVSVWDVFYENETAYIVMDYIKGETLKNRLLRTAQPLSEQACVELLTPIMEDLDAVHARGIIHRDIKPDNIMLCENGEPMLLDLGAAKDLYKSAPDGAPSSNLVVSQGFSPVEQYSERGKIGPWTDVYAMSATIIYCVSGKVPPPAIDRSMYGDEVDFNALSPTVAAVLEKGLAIKPENRYRTMGELLNALRAAVADEQPKPKPEPRPIQKPEPKPEPERKPEPRPEPKIEKKPPSARKRLLLPIGAAAALVILAVGIFVGGKDKIPTVTNTTSKVSAIVKPEATPIPTPSGEPLSTGKFGVLSYEEFIDCIRVSNCKTSATNVEIPAEIEGKPVTSIGDRAFSVCSSLTSITIPDSVTSIGDCAFSDCDSLTNVTIPDSVTRIGNAAFTASDSLTSITLSSNVKEMSTNPAPYCHQLREFVISAQNPYFKVIDGVLFTADGKKLLAFPARSALETYAIPESVTEIGSDAFCCSSLTSITIPNSVTSIGDGVFRYCNSLKSITIPISVTSIGLDAFNDCSNLKDIYYVGTEEQWNAIAIAESKEMFAGITIHFGYQN